MNPQKKIILGILVLSVFVFIVALSSLYVQTQIDSGNACGCLIPIPIFIPFLASIGLFVGTLIYFFFSSRFNTVMDGEKKEQGNYIGMENLLFKLMSSHESLIIRCIIKNKGEMTQSQIVKETQLPKVRVFRSLEKMVSRGILEKEPHGKTNKIRLSKDFMSLVG